jgi:hypothetical protein
MSELAMAGVAGGESVSSLGSASGAHNEPWSLVKRIAFRFFFSYFVLFGFPFPIDRIPFVDEIIDKVYYEPWQRLAAWVGEQLAAIKIVKIQFPDPPQLARAPCLLRPPAGRPLDSREATRPTPPPIARSIPSTQHSLAVRGRTLDQPCAGESRVPPS